MYLYGKSVEPRLSVLSIFGVTDPRRSPVALGVEIRFDRVGGFVARTFRPAFGCPVNESALPFAVRQFLCAREFATFGVRTPRKVIGSPALAVGAFGEPSSYGGFLRRRHSPDVGSQRFAFDDPNTGFVGRERCRLAEQFVNSGLGVEPPDADFLGNAMFVCAGDVRGGRQDHFVEHPEAYVGLQLAFEITGSVEVGFVLDTHHFSEPVVGIACDLTDVLPAAATL